MNLKRLSKYKIVDGRYQVPVQSTIGDDNPVVLSVVVTTHFMAISGIMQLQIYQHQQVIRLVHDILETGDTQYLEIDGVYIFTRKE